MKALLSWEDYAFLIRKSKAQGYDYYNNFYLGQDRINRYIDLGRIEYEWNESGFYLYTNEESYYRLYLQCNTDKIDFSRKEKPILIRNVYRINNKGIAQQKLELRLQNMGFVLYDKTMQIVASPLNNIDAILKRKYDAERFLERFGLKIIYAGIDQLDSIYRLKNSTPELKPYHYFYETQAEKEESIKKEYYRCVINDQNQVCAAQQFHVEKNTAQGNWLAVAPEYKQKCGIGVAMAYHSFVYAIEHGIKKYFGWVVSDDEQSIRYHQAIGYELTDKVAEEWILMPEEKNE